MVEINNRRGKSTVRISTSQLLLVQARSKILSSVLLTGYSPTKIFYKNKYNEVKEIFTRKITIQ